MDIEEWKKKNSRPAGYTHFDKKIGLNSTWDYITNPKKIKQHSFYPFIHFDQVFYKYSKKDDKDKVKEKVRPICYSAHVDRCIYQYYGYLLNEKYNEYSYNKGFSKCIVAYRTNLHKNNIHFAKEAFDFIKQGDCNIMVGDFTGFFDNLDHKYLKKMLCAVLESKSLSEDWYAVFKNITNYSTWELIELLKLNGLLTNEEIQKIESAKKEAKEKGRTRKAREYSYLLSDKIKELNKKDLVLSKANFSKHKKNCIVPNINHYGIPQGSAISAVLSNVYMIEFDKVIFEYVKSLNGLYLRYSDDFIIIIPTSNIVSFEKVKTNIFDTVKNINGLDLQPDKTKLYFYSKENQIIENISGDKFNDHIDYLGFIFDGKEVSLRHKTVSKYYYRMYKKLNHIVKCNGITKNKNKISCENLYQTYSQKGRNGQYDKTLLPEKVLKIDKNNPYASGNFFTYVDKADKIFNPDKDATQEPITRATKRHLLKIRRKLQEI